MLENDSPRLDRLNEYRPQVTLVDAKMIVRKILVQSARIFVVETQ